MCVRALLTRGARRCSFARRITLSTTAIVSRSDSASVATFGVQSRPKSDAGLTATATTATTAKANARRPRVSDSQARSRRLRTVSQGYDQTRTVVRAGLRRVRTQRAKSARRFRPSLVRSPTRATLDRRCPHRERSLTAQGGLSHVPRPRALRCLQLREPCGPMRYAAQCSKPEERCPIRVVVLNVQSPTLLAEQPVNLLQPFLLVCFCGHGSQSISDGGREPRGQSVVKTR